MNVLEKILEEIKEAFDENIDDVEDSAGIHHFAIDSFTAWYIARKIIRSHMDEVPKCGECSRRKQYMQGYKDGKKDDGWIPVEERLPEENDGKYYPMLNVSTSYGAVKWGFYRVRDKEWYIYSEMHGEFIKAEDKEVIAWQTLPEPYKEV